MVAGFPGFKTNVNFIRQYYLLNFRGRKTAISCRDATVFSESVGYFPPESTLLDTLSFHNMTVLAVRRRREFGPTSVRVRSVVNKWHRCMFLPKHVGFACKYHPSSAPYSFIHQSQTTHDLSNRQSH